MNSVISKVALAEEEAALNQFKEQKGRWKPAEVPH